MWTALVAATAMQVSAFDQARLSVIANRVCEQTIAASTEPKIAPEHLEVSIAALDRNAGTYVIGHHRGDAMMYPASVVKLVYACYLAELLDKGKVKKTTELDRAVKDMLVESSNDATGLVLDVVTGTSGGPELAPVELKKWMEKRQAVNRWLVSKGITGQNACQKTWNEGPYGRERQGYGPNFELRNMLTPNACTRLMADLALGKIASPSSTDWVLGYVKRVVKEDGSEVGGQTKGFIGEALPRSWERYSKAGWAYKVRHDVCWFKTPDGKEFVITIFTDQHGNNASLLPEMTRRTLRELGLGGSTQ